MKTYVKILFITLGIQLGFSFLEYWMISKIYVNSNIIFLCAVMKYLLSLLIDVILSLTWGKNIKEKILCIFFMLTNYTWLVSLFFMSYLIEAFLNEIIKLPDDFGSNIIRCMKEMVNSV